MTSTRHRSNSGADVDMFPFLSVLCALIGVLILFILLVVGTRVIDAEQHAAPGAGTQLEARQSAASSEEIRRLQQELEQASAEYDAQSQRVAALEQLKRRLEQILKRKMEQLQLSGGEGIVHGIDLGADEQVEMAPAADFPVTKSPVFVEVQYDQYVAHPDGARYFVNDLPVPDIAYDARGLPSSSAIEFFESIAQTRDERYLIFLVRPNGAAAFRRVYQYLTRRYPHPSGVLSNIDIGWEPYSQDWVLVSRNLAN